MTEQMKTNDSESEIPDTFWNWLIGLKNCPTLTGSEITFAKYTFWILPTIVIVFVIVEIRFDIVNRIVKGIFGLFGWSQDFTGFIHFAWIILFIIIVLVVAPLLDTAIKSGLRRWLRRHDRGDGGSAPEP